MTKGRNTSVLSIRLPDETVNRLKKLARSRRQTMTELLKPVLQDYATTGRSYGKNYNPYKYLQEDNMSLFSENEEESMDEKGFTSGTKKETQTPERRKYPGTGRNEPCPCGSGLKYKKCCGA